MDTHTHTHTQTICQLFTSDAGTTFQRVPSGCGRAHVARPICALGGAFFFFLPPDFFFARRRAAHAAAFAKVFTFRAGVEAEAEGGMTTSRVAGVYRGP